MFGKPLYAYTGFVFSVPINDEAIPQWFDGGGGVIPTSWDGKSYRIDFGLYPIGEGRFQIGTGFGEYQGSNETYESFNVKALHFPIYVALGTKEVITRASSLPLLLFGINTSYWHSVSKKLNTKKYICCDPENYDKFQNSGYIFIVFNTTDNGDSYSVQVSQNYLNFEGGNDLQRVGETTVGLGYYFK